MKANNKYRIIILIAATVMSLIVIFLHILSHEQAKDIYLAQAETVVLDLKKSFLYDTVNNLLKKLMI